MNAPPLRTQVGIVGSGPAGLFLSHILHQHGIDSVVLERRSRAHLESRVRAGVLERGTSETLDALGLGGRMRREGMVDEGFDIRFDHKTIRFDLPELTGGHSVMVYGQQEVVKDLVAARLAAGQPLLFEAEVTGIDGLDGALPTIRYNHGGAACRLVCDFVAACDGYHGAGRQAAPPGAITVHERQYEFAWLGVLSRSRPMEGMTYSNSGRGFALCSRRSMEVSRLYLQVPATEDAAAWSDDRFWDELHRRMYDDSRTEIVEGEIFQRDVAKLRAFVAAPMQHGRMFLAGDAVHIVPPTGAKGMNLAVADARVLGRALVEHYRTGSMERLAGYSDVCLRRVWRTVRFSTMLTGLMHRFPGHSPLDRELQQAELGYIHGSRAAQVSIAEQYVGLPMEGL